MLKAYLESPRFAVGRSTLRAVLLSPVRGYLRHFPILAGKRAVWKHIAEHLYWLEPPRIEAKTFFGAKLLLDGRDSFGRLTYYFHIWEPTLTAWINDHLREHDCFIDVGANVGYFSLLSSSLVGASGVVVAVEALPGTFELLKHNLSLNRIENVRPLNVAAWDKEEQLTIYHPAERITGVTTAMRREAQFRNLQSETKVQAAPLSSLLRKNEIEAARIIKIDVEGAERQVVRGLLPILSRTRRDLHLAVEIQRDSFDDVVGMLREEGFLPYHLNNEYSVRTYLQVCPTRRLQRLEAMPAAAPDVDAIFSRVDSSFLS